MPDHIRDLLESRGLVRRRVLVKAGLSHRRLNRLVASGDLRVLAPDVIALPGEPAVDEDLRAAAVALDAVVSGPTAALQRGWGLVSAPAEPTMTVARDRSRLPRDGMDLSRRDLQDGDVEEREGLRLTSALRTAVDCARDLPLVEGVAAVDSALRCRDVTLAGLDAALVALPAGRGRAAVARVLALVDPDAGSVLESVCRVVLHLAGLAPERTQLVIARGRARIGRVDFAWPSALLVVEVDGFEFHSDRASYRRDRRRTTALARAGWTVLRFSWEDVTHSPDWVVDSVREALGPCRRCAA